MQVSTHILPGDDVAHKVARLDSGTLTLFLDIACGDDEVTRFLIKNVTSSSPRECRKMIAALRKAADEMENLLYPQSG